MDKKTYEFISKQLNDPIVERRTCSRTGKEFPVFQGDLDLLEKFTITIGEKKYTPIPNTLSPEARLQYKLMFRNDRNLYKTTCALTGKPTISRICPDMGFQVYTNEARASDARDYCSYGLDIDNNKNIFDHIQQLVNTTPYQDLIWSFSNLQNNSVYTNYTADISDCYYVFDSNTLEKSCYIKRCSRSKELFDCFWTNDSELCFECIDCGKMYQCFFCNSCTSCAQSYYLYNCHGCTNCIGCTNLVNKQYYINNQAFSKEEYGKIFEQLKNNKYQNKEIQDKFSQLLTQSPRKNLHTINSEKAIGNYIFNSKNVVLSELINDAENIRHCYEIGESQDCFDVCGYGHDSFLLYNSTQVGRYSNHIYCCSTIGKGENLIYCIETKKSRNCFGCVNLKDKEYCIFNKQYTKEEYEILIPQLIERMQKENTRLDFLPTTYVPYPYNDTVANEYFPIKAEQLTILEPEKYISDAILDLWGTEKIKIKRRTRREKADIPAGVQVITCEVSDRPFRLVGLEEKFYKKYNLPLPTKHPDIRHAERLAQRPGSELYLRTCDACKKEILSVYPNNTKTQVYCELCYQKEIYG